MKMLFEILAVVSVFVALPALGRRSWTGFLAAIFVSAFGVVLPLFVFLASAFMIPEWKGGASHGWIDCFHLGKLALTPVVLWATAAFYKLEVFKSGHTKPWVVLGFLSGAVVSSACMVFGLVCVENEAGKLWLLVPIYVAVWYSVRAANLMSAARLNLRTCLTALASSLPLWVLGMFWSWRTYQGLSDQPPSCFVVTAASRGHPRIVGPLFEVTRYGRKRTANSQLLTFWQFEDGWRKSAPRSHATFRRFYNRVGPALAGGITQPWMADVVHLMLKPAELTAAMLLRMNGSQIVTAEPANIQFRKKQGGLI